MGSFRLFFFHQVDNLPNTWPTWVNNLTFFSHLLLAINASVNLLLYCFCDKHFWVITQKTLKVNINSTKEYIFEVDYFLPYNQIYRTFFKCFFTRCGLYGRIQCERVILIVILSKQFPCKYVDQPW